MKWLITGAGGQLGKTLTAFLQAAGAEVESHSRQSLDISDESEVASAIERSRPEILVNCAAWTDVDGAEEDTEGAIRANATGAQNLAKVANAIGARLIHISTDFVFGADNKEIYSEDDPHCPVNFYGASKALGENLVTIENPEAVILRASWLYSPHGKNFPKAIIRKLITDESTLEVVNDQIGQPTSCLSLSNTILSISTIPKVKGIIHGSSVGSVSRYEFAQRIASVIGFSPDRIRSITSESLSLPAKRPKRSVLGHDKLKIFDVPRPLTWDEDLEVNADAIVRQTKLELK
jgi:dTDP-4-dehydrorhamnose reductase